MIAEYRCFWQQGTAKWTVWNQPETTAFAVPGFLAVLSLTVRTIQDQSPAGELFNRGKKL